MILYRETLLSGWDNPLSHDQTMYNTSMRVALDTYNSEHNFLALCNCNISVVHDLFLVLLHLGLICAPKISFAPFLCSSQGATFWPKLCR